MTVEVRLPIRRGGFSLEVALDLPPVGVTALTGASGSGKTSLLRAVAGLDRHEPGTVKIGETVWQGSGEFVPTHRRSLGYVFQEAALFHHLTVRQNLEYGRKRAPRSVQKLTPDKAVDLLGIGTLMDRKPATLSGGERQRVAVARALAVGPQILLMDEPLASLDRERKEEFLPYLAALPQALEIPILYASHASNEIAHLADHVVLLGDGRVVASGPLAEVTTRLDLPPALGRDAAAVIAATVAGHEAQYGLVHLAFPGGSFVVAASGLAIGVRVRLQIAARDVSLARDVSSGSSILNALPVVVESLANVGEAEVVVKLRAGAAPLLARVTRKSVTALGIAPGVKMIAQVKSVALLH